MAESLNMPIISISADVNDDDLKSIRDEIVEVLQLEDDEHASVIIDDLFENGRESLKKYEKHIIKKIFQQYMENNDNELINLLKKYFWTKWEIQYRISDERFVKFLLTYKQQNKDIYDRVLIRTAQYGNKYMKDYPILSIILQLLLNQFDDDVFDDLWCSVTNDGIESIKNYSDYISQTTIDHLLDTQSILFQTLRKYYRESVVRIFTENKIKNRGDLYELALNDVTQYGWLTKMKSIEDGLTPNSYEIILVQFASLYKGNKKASHNEESELFDVSSEKVFEAIDKEYEDNSRTNIIVAGQTGVGKSTLINAIFKRDIAKTSVGAPVTQDITEYKLDGTSVTLYDTRGLEMEKYKETVKQLRSFVEKQQKDDDPNNHIHIGWVCILESSNRIQDGDHAIVEMLKKHMKVIIVVCQSISANDSFICEVRKQFSDLKVIPVLAKEMPIRNSRPLQPMGLEELSECTTASIPEGHQKAFIAAQAVSLQGKQMKSHAVVVSAAASAGAVGASPIPFSDVALLVPIQAGMIAGITAIFGLRIDRSVIASILGIFITAGAGSAAGLGLASALKLIPGVGTIAGGVINASIAATVTTTFGEAYIFLLTKLFEENEGKPPTAEQVLAKCKEWKGKKSAKN